ncbi:hypothetical protein AAZX31_15G181900 [Glycine max]
MSRRDINNQGFYIHNVEQGILHWPNRGFTFTMLNKESFTGLTGVLSPASTFGAFCTVAIVGLTFFAFLEGFSCLSSYFSVFSFFKIESIVLILASTSTMISRLRSLCECSKPTGF